MPPRLTQPEVLGPAAIEFLTLIKDLSIPEDSAPEEIREFLLEISPRFVARCAAQRRFHRNSAGHKVLSGNAGDHQFYATLLPRRGRGKAALHAFFGPRGLSQPIKAITFLKDAIPVAQRTELVGDFGRQQIIDLSDQPREIFTLTQELASLMVGQTISTPEPANSFPVAV